MPPKKRVKAEPIDFEIPQEPPAGTSQEERMRRSEKNMQRARIFAMTNKGFNREEWRDLAVEIIKKTTGYDAYTHQLNTGEALALGMDCLVIAGTGSGKTMAFTLPVMMTKREEHRMVWVFSPLKELQWDQVERFKKMGLKAVAVNGESYTDELYQDIIALKYDVLLSGPEMCLYHPGFSRAVRNSDFMSHFDAFIIDEAHLIPQWGANFREVYYEVGRLRSFFPDKCPVLATTATANPEDVKCIERILHIHHERMYYWNLGNDRPNIRQIVKIVNSPNKYTEIEDILDQLGTGEPWPSIMIFGNTIKDVRAITRSLRRVYPDRQDEIDSYFARRRPASKRKVMKRFRDGMVKVLCTTEAAGMGADIPNVDIVIQWGVPPTLSNWIQHAGRAGRAGQQSDAFLMVEPSVLQQINQEPKCDVGDTLDGDKIHDDSSATPLGFRYRKACDPHLRGYITTSDCRRRFLDEYFDNPPRNTHSPPLECCDNCTRTLPNSTATSGPNFSLDSPVDIGSSIINLSGDRDDNGSEGGDPTVATADSDVELGTLDSQLPPMSQGLVTLSRKRPRPRTSLSLLRSGKYLEVAKAALLAWRNEVYQNVYSTTSLTPESLLSADMISAIARQRSIDSFELLANRFSEKWHYCKKYGPEVIRVLEEVETTRRREEDAKRERDRLEKAECARKKARIKKENEEKVGVQFTFVHFDPQAPKRKRAKQIKRISRVPLATIPIPQVNKKITCNNL